MSEREVIKFKADEPPKEEVKVEVSEEEARVSKKAKFATILERGVVNDRLHVELPDDTYGEWIRNDAMEINRMQALGFDIDYKFAPKRALHNDGNGAAVIGDVIFMTCSRENKDIIDEVMAERIHAIHNPRKPKEEKDFENQTLASTGGIIPTINESQQRSVKKAEIAAALGATD